MQGYNLIFVFNPAKDRLLMCRRRKAPYEGLSNLVGGKIEPGEPGLAAAYRELHEETGITHHLILLCHLMDYTYYLQDCYVEVYAGRLLADVPVAGEENDLYWSELTCDFFDMRLYAGEGNIGHMLEQIRMNDHILFHE